MSDEQAIEIDAPVETVWQAWTDVAAWPQWNSTVNALTRLDEGDFGIGSRARLRQPQLPAAIWEVTEWAPPTHWAWVTRQPGAMTTGHHRIEDLGGGRTRITASAVHSGPLAAVVRAVFGGLSRQLVARETADLKTRCEGGDPPERTRRPEGFRH